MPDLPPRRASRDDATGLLELAACFGLLVLTCYLVFGGGWQPAGRPYPLAFLPVPFVFWAAIRFGRGGAFVALTLEAVFTALGTFSGFGPFGVWSPWERTWLLLAHVGLLAISTLSLSVLITQMDRTRAELADKHQALQQAHAELMELDALKTHFLSTISHEMRTPMTVILGNAELLEERHPDEPTVHEILNGGLRLSNQLNRIIDYCALVSGSMPLYKRDVNLPELLANVRGMFEAGEAERGVHLKTEIDRNLPPIDGDSRRLMQILVELVDNARKVTPPGGTIGIRAIGNLDAVRLEVWDTGEGLPKRQTDRLNLGLTHLETAQSLENGALGLGLTIVKKLTELHGGHLELDSAPGRGSRFAVVLPAAH